jgi:predicted small metal-binding protein
MSKLRCADYGFECKFEAGGEADSIIEEFGKHSEEEHGIDYPKEALIQFIVRKKD